MFYFGRRFHAAVTLSRPAEVACEKCGCRYRYELVRRATGWAVAPYMIGAGSGAERARRHANRVAQGRLDRGCEPVACPDCGWFQRDMVREVRRRMSRRLETFAIGLPVLAGVILVAMALVETNGFQRSFAHLMDNDGPVVWKLVIFMVAMPVVCLGAQAALRFGIDPNRTGGRFADAPAAIRIGAGASRPRAGRTEVESPGGPPAANDELTDGWTTVQLLNARWPAACVACLTPTQQTRAVNPLGQALVKVNVPVCPPCQLRDKQWSWGAGIAAAAVVAAITLPLVVGRTPNADGLVAGVGMLLIAGLAGLCAVIAVDRFRRPVRFRKYAADRNTVQLRFKHPGYAERFVVANRPATKRRVAGPAPARDRPSISPQRP